MRDDHNFVFNFRSNLENVLRIDFSHKDGKEIFHFLLVFFCFSFCRRLRRSLLSTTSKKWVNENSLI